LFALDYVYCIGALNLKGSDIQLLICQFVGMMHLGTFFSLKEMNLLTLLQVNFGTLDFKHLYDLYKFKFLTTIGTKYAYGLPLVESLDSQFHMPVYIASKYHACTKSRPSVVSSIYRHCADLCYSYLVWCCRVHVSVCCTSLLFFFFFVAFVANKVIYLSRFGGRVITTY